RRRWNVMSLDGAQITQPDDFLGRLYRALTTLSQYIVYIAILAMMLVMVAEVLMRYIITEPLGWDISLAENILIPGLVFLGLPLAYSISAHVAAGIIYDLFPRAVRRTLDWITRLLLITCAIFLIYAGTHIAVDAFVLGSVPPPLSSQVG